MHTTQSGRLVSLFALALVFSLAFLHPAHADDRYYGRQGDRDWREHEGHARYWHRHYYPGWSGGAVYPPPPVVYAPPPVVYGPPPPSPGINLVVPLNFR